MSDTPRPAPEEVTRRTYRVAAGSRPHEGVPARTLGQSGEPALTPAGTRLTGDGFSNAVARLGMGQDNVMSAGTYGFNGLSRNRQLLEFMYRSSWIVGRVCDAVAQDMTRAGVRLNGQFADNALDQTHREARKLKVWDSYESGLTWSRLYGGCILVLLIAGQDLSTPLNLDTVTKGQFRGLLPLDRWMVQPSFNSLVEELGPELGKPKYYFVTANAPALMGKTIHYSRIVRLEGVKLPFWQAQAENFWGMSVIERLYDRLIAFDSTTQGTAQLVFKAYLRTYKVEDLRDILTGGEEALNGFLAQMDAIRRFQTSEGLTVMDKNDEMDTHQYSFAGLSDVLLRFAEQLSGAAEIPLVRMFGQSPSGFATGDSDLQNYYDLITSEQNSELYSSVTLTYDLLHRSATGMPPPADFNVEFESLWQMSEKERADIGEIRVRTILMPFETGIIDQGQALQELANQSDAIGVFGSITPKDIDAARQAAPPPGELGLDLDEDPTAGQPGAPNADPAGEDGPPRPRLVVPLPTVTGR